MLWLIVIMKDKDRGYLNFGIIIVMNIVSNIRKIYCKFFLKVY